MVDKGYVFLYINIWVEDLNLRFFSYIFKNTKTY